MVPQQVTEGPKEQGPPPQMAQALMDLCVTLEVREKGAPQDN